MYSQKITSCINLQLPIEIFKNRLFQTCIIVKHTCITIFSKIGSNQSKPCTQIYLQMFLICINLELVIRISKNHTFRTCTAPSRTFRPILRSIGLLDIEIPRKEIISTDDRRTDGQTDDGRTDVAHDNNMYRHAHNCSILYFTYTEQALKLYTCMNVQQTYHYFYLKKCKIKCHPQNVSNNTNFKRFPLSTPSNTSIKPELKYHYFLKIKDNYLKQSNNPQNYNF